MAIGLHHSKARPSAKLVLLGIANHDGDGGAWPSVATLAVYASVDRSNVQRAITKLEELGEIERVIQAGGFQSTNDWDRPNLYRFKLQCPPNCDRTTAHRILCDVCWKALSPARRSSGVHLACISLEKPEGGPRQRGGVAPARPEPPSYTTTDIEITRVLNREAFAPCGHKWMTDCAGRYCEYGHAVAGASA